MPENSNTPSENEPLDSEDWELAFAAYESNSGAALQMGFCLMVIKGYLSYDPPKIREVLEGIDHAIEALFPYTQFHGLCHGMYIKIIGGEHLTTEEEETLKKLGVKF